MGRTYVRDSEGQFASTGSSGGSSKRKGGTAERVAAPKAANKGKNVKKTGWPGGTFKVVNNPVSGKPGRTTARWAADLKRSGNT